MSLGSTEAVDVPSLRPGRGQVLVRTHRTIVSAGTERMLVDFGKAGLLDKARQQPDKVRQALEKIRTDGLLPTVTTVRGKLEHPLAMGYCNVGSVIEIGAGVAGFSVGDRVACNGKHAEIVAVPMNLCAKVPQALPDDEAAFAVLGAIALQGIRLVQPTLGECVVVTGLGLIGLLTVQLLRAHGCRVLGIDFDPARLQLAREFGAKVFNPAESGDPQPAALEFSRGRGVDAVILTASTKSSEPVHQAAVMCRKRGRIVLVGVTGLELSRADFYEKELTFQVSCSYGPGRYDPCYEEKGQDYPIGFVRWTEQRNFEAVLDMMAEGRLDVRPLVSHRFSIDDAERAYALVSGPEPSLGILLEYPFTARLPDQARARTVTLPAAASWSRTDPLSGSVTPKEGGAVLGFIGAGNYATGVLIPAFKATPARLKTVASNGGVTALHAGRKFGMEQATTDTAAVLGDPEVDAIVVSTRHDSHASYVCDAIAAGKHVFVEKPLAVDLEGLSRIEAAFAAAAAAERPQLIMVGFNRRFAPQVRRMNELLRTVSQPKVFVMTVNAGEIPPSHWTQDLEAGGGRIIGEGCHFIDLLRHLAGSPIDDWTAQSLLASAAGMITDDKATITLRFADGSLGTIHYLANGHRSFPKERLEVFCGGKVLQLDNFRRLTGYGWPRFSRMNLWSQDKGQKACAAAFVDAVSRGGPSPIPFDELLEVSRVTIEIGLALRQGR